MRTSLEIPDPLFREAKRLALETDTTLKNLVAEGLERILSEKRREVLKEKPDSARLPKVRPKGKGVYMMTNADIEHILAEEEAANHGRPR